MGLARFESLSPPAIQVKPAIPSNYSPKAKMFNSLTVCTEPEQQGLDLQGLFDRIGKF